MCFVAWPPLGTGLHSAPHETSLQEAGAKVLWGFLLAGLVEGHRAHIPTAVGATPAPQPPSSHHTEKHKCALERASVARGWNIQAGQLLLVI